MHLQIKLKTFLGLQFLLEVFCQTMCFRKILFEENLILWGRGDSKHTNNLLLSQYSSDFEISL